MLLRASRASEFLTKEALLGAAKNVAGFAGRHWKGIGGTALVGGAAAGEISNAARRSNVGLQQPYLQARNAGLVPSVPH